jgi:uncharacterized membrane protein YkoI
MTNFGIGGSDVRRRSMLASVGISVIVATVLALPVIGLADDRDQERALKALKAGEVLPLRTMLDEVERRFSGDILEVELELELDDEEDEGRRFWAYEIKLISPEGNVIKLTIDAKTKEILQIEGRGAEKARKK